MKKGWKITLISLGSLLGVVLIVVAVAMWLVFTPKQLTKIVNSLSSKFVQCETKFESVDLTLLSTFPDAGLKVGKVVVINPTPGAPNDTLAQIGSLTVGVDVKAFLKEKKVIVHQVALDGARANIYIDKDGNTNFDIFGEKDTVPDTSASSFVLPDTIDIASVKINDMCATFLDEKDGLSAMVDDIDLMLKGNLHRNDIDAKLTIDGKGLSCSMKDSVGADNIVAELKSLALRLKAEGNDANVDGDLQISVDKGTVAIQGSDMINETLLSSRKKLIDVKVPFNADMAKKVLKVEKGELNIDSYALEMNGKVALADSAKPMDVDLHVSTIDAWQVAPLLAIVPQQYVQFAKGMSVDAGVSFKVDAVGQLSDSLMPIVDATVMLADGSFYDAQMLPYKLKKINAEVDAHLDMNNKKQSSAVVRSLSACAGSSKVSLSGRADNLLDDMMIDAAVKGDVFLADALLMVPKEMNVDIAGRAKLSGTVNTKMSSLQNMTLEKVRTDCSVAFTDLNFTMDSMHAASKDLTLNVKLPASKHVGKFADVSVASNDVLTFGMENASLTASVDHPTISIGVNNPLKEQIAAAFDIVAGSTNANLDSTDVSLSKLAVKGSMRMDSLQSNPLRKFNPYLDLNLGNIVLNTPAIPGAVQVYGFDAVYSAPQLEIRKAQIQLGQSDFEIYGKVEDAEGWLSGEKMLVGDLNLVSQFTDADQLMAIFSGMGNDEDTIAKQREEDNVPAEDNPFIVPKDVDVTLHTHVKNCVAFNNDLSGVAGTLTINDGKAILEQMGFVCKAATMQLTAIYESPRPNNLFVALDFHLLDIQIDELLDMIPTVDSLVPMLAAFNGNANFHLAAETYLFSNYTPKMSTLLGAAAISGKDLVVMDNNSIAQIAKIMQFKSWKDKDNKIKIDSLDVEMTCFRKEIEVYPFLLNIGKYQLCASGKHNLDNKCNYHVELLKNPLLAKVGVDVKGDLSSPKITLGEVKYSDLYKPAKQGAVEKRTLEMKEKIRKALEANVR